MKSLPKNIGRVILASLLAFFIGLIWGKSTTPKLPIYKLKTNNNYLDTEKKVIYEEVTNTGNQSLYNVLMVISKYNEQGQTIPIYYYDLADKLKPNESVLCNFEKPKSFCDVNYHYR